MGLAGEEDSFDLGHRGFLAKEVLYISQAITSDAIYNVEK